jgi:hypothetical protein
LLSLNVSDIVVLTINMTIILDVVHYLEYFELRFSGKKKPGPWTVPELTVMFVVCEGHKYFIVRSTGCNGKVRTNFGHEFHIPKQE